MPFKIHTYFLHYFRTVSETTKAWRKSVVFVPESESYAADAIIVPIAANGDGDQIIIVEISVTDPRDPSRVNKVMKWFDEGSLVSQVKAVHQGREIVILLCWDGLLENSRHTAFLELENVARMQNITISVADSECLRKFGVSF